jgi:glycosyltransferase involved in cell wall biosynthesis
MATYEQALTKLYDRLVVASPADLTAIGEYNNLSVVPNGVDVKANPYFAGPRERQSIVFSGTMFYFPNVDAARWFAGEIFPLVRQAIPGAIVSFVGTRPTRTIRALARPGLINVTGFVPSVYKFVSGATVAFAPMRSGSGTQFKVLEAMSAGTPVIGTSLAFAGLAVTDGLHALTADSAQDFAGRVIEVMSNPSRYRPMAEAARRLVEERYDWAVTVRALENAYAEAIEIRQSAGASA